MKLYQDPHNRGDADAYYHRDAKPHKRMQTDSGLVVDVFDLTPEETSEYMRGYEEGLRLGQKDWG